MAPLIVRQGSSFELQTLASLPEVATYHGPWGGGMTCNSTAPISQAGPKGRELPTWSTPGHGALSPALTAGLVNRGRCVSVKPPLLASPLKSGLVLVRSPEALSEQLASLPRLCPCDANGPEHCCAPPILPAIIVLVRLMAPAGP